MKYLPSKNPVFSHFQVFRLCVNLISFLYQWYLPCSFQPISQPVGGLPRTTRKAGTFVQKLRAEATDVRRLLQEQAHV